MTRVLTSLSIAVAVAGIVFASQANAAQSAKVLKKPPSSYTTTQNNSAQLKRRKRDQIVIPTNPVKLHCDIYPRNC